MREHLWAVVRAPFEPASKGENALPALSASSKSMASERRMPTVELGRREWMTVRRQACGPRLIGTPLDPKQAPAGRHPTSVSIVILAGRVLEESQCSWPLRSFGRAWRSPTKMASIEFASVHAHSLARDATWVEDSPPHAAPHPFQLQPSHMKKHRSHRPRRPYCSKPLLPFVSQIRKCIATLCESPFWSAGPSA